MDAHTALAGSKIKPKQRLFCSFCGNADDEVDLLIATMGTNICAGCIDACTEIVATHRATSRGDREYASWFERSEPPNVEAKRALPEKD